MRFEFPDPANFPETKALVFPKDRAFEIPKFERPDKFPQDLDKLFAVVHDRYKTSTTKAMHRGVRRAAQAYFQFKVPGDSEMTEDGVAHRLVPTTKLLEYFHPQVTDLLARDDPGPKDLRIDRQDRIINLEDHASLEKVRKFLSAVGLFDVLEGYARRKVGVRMVSVMVARPSDRHNYQQFRDCETTTKLLNLHLDPKPGILKAVINLSDVTARDGPFSVMKGSHKWEYDEVERIFAWGNSTSNYLQTPEHRQAACALPKRFRKNSIIGRMIPDGCELSNFFLKNLTRFTSDVATAIIFDPSFTFHRGSICDKGGERITLQVVLR